MSSTKSVVAEAAPRFCEKAGCVQPGVPIDPSEPDYVRCHMNTCLELPFAEDVAVVDPPPEPKPRKRQQKTVAKLLQPGSDGIELERLRNMPGGTMTLKQFARYLDLASDF